MMRQRFVREWAWWVSRRVTDAEVERTYGRHLMTRAERDMALGSVAVTLRGVGLMAQEDESDG